MKHTVPFQQFLKCHLSHNNISLMKKMKPNLFLKVSFLNTSSTKLQKCISLYKKRTWNHLNKFSGKSTSGKYTPCVVLRLFHSHSLALWHFLRKPSLGGRRHSRTVLTDFTGSFEFYGLIVMLSHVRKMHLIAVFKWLKVKALPLCRQIISHSLW